MATNQNISISQTNLPAHLQHVSQDAIQEFSGGVRSGFPVLSYRGKVWRVKVSGEEQVYVDSTTGDAIQSIEGTLVKSNPTLAKTYYAGKYSEGDNDKPRCWSSGGEKPDSDVPNPVNTLCTSCPMNVWGSRTSEEGKKMKACQDVRRTAFIFRHDLEMVTRNEKTLDDVPVMLLRIPPASLHPLKDYAERVLAPKGAAPFMLHTKIGFDTDASYPKLTFRGSQWLSETEFGIVSELRDSDTVRRILDTSAEHATEGNTDDSGEAVSNEAPAKAEAPEAAPSVASAQTREENFSAPAEPSTAPARPAAIEQAAAGIVPTQPTAASPKNPPAPTLTSRATAQPSSKEAPANPSPNGSDADIDEMLSSILD